MPFSGEVGEQQFLNSFCAQSELLRSNSQDIDTIKPPGIPGALCLDGQSLAEHTGLNGGPLPHTHMLKRPNRHLSLAGWRRNSRRFLKEGRNLAIGTALKPDKVVYQSAKPSMIFRSQPDW
jgi:hypothetical protein